MPTRTSFPAAWRNARLWRARWSTTRSCSFSTSPLGQLDSLTRITMQGELVSLWQRAGFTALLVTHDVEEALFLAGRVIVLSQRPAHIKAEIVNASPIRAIGATRIWSSFVMKCSRISVSTRHGSLQEIAPGGHGSRYLPQTPS